MTVQNVIDIGAHMLADLGDSRRDGYWDIPESLSLDVIISAALTGRERDTHGYVAKLRERLADFDRFTQETSNLFVPLRLADSKSHLFGKVSPP